MSVVTTVLFTCCLSDDDKITEVNRYFTEAEFPQQGLVNVTMHAGGGKAAQAEVWLGAFNYLDEEAFFAHLRTIKGWYDAGAVRVYLNREHEAGFSLVAHLLDGFQPPLQPKPRGVSMSERKPCRCPGGSPSPQAYPRSR